MSKRQESKSNPKLDSITKQYAETLVNQLLAIHDTAANDVALAKLRFYDQRLREMGYRATIKVGVEKI